MSTRCCYCSIETKVNHVGCAMVVVASAIFHSMSVGDETFLSGGVTQLTDLPIVLLIDVSESGHHWFR